MLFILILRFWKHIQHWLIIFLCYHPYRKALGYVFSVKIFYFFYSVHLGALVLCSTHNSSYMNNIWHMCLFFFKECIGCYGNHTLKTASLIVEQKKKHLLLSYTAYVIKLSVMLLIMAKNTSINTKIVDTRFKIFSGNNF